MRITSLLLAGATCLLAACSSADTTADTASTSPAATTSTEQSAAVPAVSSTPATSTATTTAGKPLAEWIPAGYTTLIQEKGDINNDKIADIVLILKDTKEDQEPENESLKRPILLLLGDKSGHYTLARRNDKAVYCATCGGTMGDPLQGITIKNGYFSIENHGGSGMRWLHVVTFKYDDKDKEWYLHRDGHESFHSADPNKILEQSSKTSKDFGKIKFEQYDIEASL